MKYLRTKYCKISINEQQILCCSGDFENEVECPKTKCTEKFVFDEDCLIDDISR